MANHASSMKRVRRNNRKAVENTARRSLIKTSLKKVEKAIETGEAGAALKALQQAQPHLYRGVAKGVVTQNRAARKMSRLSARIKALEGGAGSKK